MTEPPPFRELPSDPDASDLGKRPLHLSVGAIGWVGLGGMAGTAARYGVSELVHPWGAWPTATFAVNLVGAFVLGLLLENLVRRGPDVGARRRFRLLLGTGFCGAFTTYSALAVDADLLVRGGHPGLAVGYGLGTVLAGLGTSLLGVAVASRRSRSHERSGPGAPA